MSERPDGLINAIVPAFREASYSYEQGQKVLDYLLALEARLEAMIAKAEIHKRMSTDDSVTWGVADSILRAAQQEQKDGWLLSDGHRAGHG